MAEPFDATRLQEAGLGVFFRPRDIAPLGVSHRRLQGMVSEGAIEKFGNGLYRLAQVEPTEVETQAMVAAAVPNAIICLLTALHFHHIGTQAPHEVWIALDRKARKPTRAPARVRIVRFSGVMLTSRSGRSLAPWGPRSGHLASPYGRGLLSAIATSSASTSPSRLCATR